MYSNVLREALFGVDGLLPGFEGIELRGKGGVDSAQALRESSPGPSWTARRAGAISLATGSRSRLLPGL
jgi:hypothetical protein